MFTEITPAASESIFAGDWEEYREGFFAATQSGCVRVEYVDARPLISLHGFGGNFERVQTTSMQDAMCETPVRAWEGPEGCPEGFAITFALECLREI